ncbi:hypothetical protein PWEIH_14671 [Listeria weihenstephanensis FSL R9-0317]|uniref:Uncharacterized protein n=1 Tax=Listeria weihenstephanensis TaxID=1006155 RepID=A0A1S7FVK4_9LIST|nr:hypothetical protein [Listeria weihenstephanensis]AQY51443.1 hypothetical protein UE46_10605 [Listeria weihenstephanensis]EUJ35796.1 hypothetical protein PWEIH_14671 [Listeria weihenstephanensis FSL R9-0317]MBC1501282.1 hypothetical protein [Listeria weihenstephanensis]
MTFNEFSVYMTENLTARESFYEKALEFQNEKNKKRPPAKRWKQVKLDRAVNAMWQGIMKTMYDKIKPSIKRDAPDLRQAWLDYFTKYGILESMDEALSEIEFE